MDLYLKKIEVQGFKSFADKTEVEFKGGITAVVGPNGSGKSNISDALRWVLGEQSAKTLRGSKMEDVIFAGTNNRRPTGFAEVTLVLDNKEGSLPIDYSEVSVTRRVFRSGESEYYINKNSCRLKDVRELFMDTGVGKDGYSIIGQGRIDEILSTKSEDRRMIFEEAAGIVKYKTRKEEAEKKLEKTKENLIRINDIINELENQIEPLQNQSEKAKEYLLLSEKLKDLEVSLFVREYDRLKEELNHIEEQKELVVSQLKYNEEKRDAFESKYNKVKNEIEKMDAKIEEIQNFKYSTQNIIEKNEGELKLSKERIFYLEKETERHLNDVKLIEKQINDTNDKENEEMDHKLELEKKVEALDIQLNRKVKELEDLINSMKKTEESMENNKSDLIQYLNQIADKKSKLNSISTFSKSINKRIEQIEHDINGIRLQIEENSKQSDNISEEILNYKNTLDGLNKEKREKIKARDQVITHQESLKAEADSIKGQVHGKLSNLKLLMEMKDEYEGYYKSVKNTLLACKNDKRLGKGVKGVVAELISVDKRYERAIEVALGSSLQNIVTETQEDAKIIIDYLKKNKLGRVTFLPISSIKARGLNAAERKLLGSEGLIGVASELINFHSDYNKIFEYLLGRVLIVETLDDGIKLSKQSGHSYKIVSLDGEILNPGGSMTGGSFNSSNTNILGRDRQIKELEEDLKELNNKYSYSNNKIGEYQKEKIELEARLLNIDDKINELNVYLVKLENKHNQFTTDNIRNNSLVEKYIREKNQLINENHDSSVDICGLEKDVETLNEKTRLTQTKIEELTEKFEKQRAIKDEVIKANTDLQVETATIKQELKAISESINSYIDNRSKLEEDIERKTKEKENNKEEVLKERTRIDSLLEEKKRLSEELLEYDIRLDEVKSERNNFMQAYYTDQEKLNEMNRKINDLQKSVSSLEVKQEKYNMQVENINTKLWEEYEMTYQMALKYKKEIENVTRVQGEIRELKNRIKALGNINLDSIEEFIKTSERFEFLKTQKKDLTEAKESLDVVIKDMNIKMKQQFKESFDIIRVNFTEVFSKLFGGGKADVLLEDEENILSSGIEIIAQPPGKKLQSLSLLSGGERALTAIALLFAILKTKPTPFCILDEIEAALDDANVYRYADYLKEFSNETQFIIITHRKGTMECADSLYGITMEEEGVSKLISVKLTEKNNERAS
ncbi:chromosome segregation protein SMC [Proteiniborus sp. MB09-C3]|uniref:chromosome segregation protein SMC n=1 Tax=Proteiniborus sp. MB09-C3 TaxID=3050072 RepID=UPI0025559560|nr:chromosome segregation protein SMC [Proteiniborus sp. MB09-C3]WIV10833.1 chromosome segregation protein SMC [Proteiniborus sp. MB09-C3]